VLGIVRVTNIGIYRITRVKLTSLESDISEAFRRQSN